METKRNLVKRAELTGSAFVKWRASMGWTQVDAAKWFKVHPRTYQGWEEGRRKYHSDHMIQDLMAKALRRKKARASTDQTRLDID